MSNKLSSILSIFYIFIAFIFGVDLVMMQYLYTDLDALSSQVNYVISENGYLTTNIKNQFKTNYHVNIYPLDTNNVSYSYEEGYAYGYILEKDYSPIIISNSTINIKIKRFAIININK